MLLGLKGQSSMEEIAFEMTLEGWPVPAQTFVGRGFWAVLIHRKPHKCPRAPACPHLPAKLDPLLLHPMPWRICNLWKTCILTSSTILSGITTYISLWSATLRQNGLSEHKSNSRKGGQNRINTNKAGLIPLKQCRKGLSSLAGSSHSTVH